MKKPIELRLVLFILAEEAGFEPARACDPCRFSKPVPSTTWVFLQAKDIISTHPTFVIHKLVGNVELGRVVKCKRADIAKNLITSSFRNHSRKMLLPRKLM